MAHPKIKTCFSILKPCFLILIVLCLCNYAFLSYCSYNEKRQEQKRKLAQENEKYRYWDELVAKNPKPDNVSQEEFIAKNNRGYCWRDEKYYTEEELKENAMVSLSEKMLLIIDLFRNGKVIDPLQEELILSRRKN